MRITKQQIKQLIKEELKTKLYEYEWVDPEFSENEQKVIFMIEELVEALKEMGESNPDMTDHYIMLMRALRDAGINLKSLTGMAGDL